MKAREPGRWILHFHINHHITNDGEEQQGGGGLTMILNASPDPPCPRPWRTLAG